MKLLLFLLLLPVVLWPEVIDGEQALIPQRIWDWLWRDAVQTGSGAIAEATDDAIVTAFAVFNVTGLAVGLWWL